MLKERIQSAESPDRSQKRSLLCVIALVFLCLSGHTSKADELQGDQKVECIRRGFLGTHYDSTKNFVNEVRKQGPTRILWRDATPEEQKSITDTLQKLGASIETRKVMPVIKAGLESVKDLSVTTLKWPVFPLMPKSRASGPIAFAVGLYEGQLVWNFVERKIERRRERKKIEKDEAYAKIRNEIQNDFRYRSIQQAFSNHVINDDQAIKRASDLNTAYNHYFKAANHRQDNVKVDEFSEFLLANPQERVLFDSLSPFVQYVPISSGSPFHKKVQIKLVQMPPQGYVLDPSSKSSDVPGPEQLHNALIVSHTKINELMNIPRWLANGPDSDETDSYQHLMNNKTENDLLRQYKGGSLSLDRFIYLVSEDASKRADQEIDRIFGVVPRDSATPAQH